MTPAFALELGSRGKFVRLIQEQLNARRPIGSLPLVVDAIMGPKTIARAGTVLGKHGTFKFDRADLVKLGVNVVLLADLSGHNEGGNKRPVDLDRMVAAGCSGVWLKLSEGQTYENTEARRQARAAPVGMLRGGYHFGDPSADRTGMDITALLDDASKEAAQYLSVRSKVFAGRAPELADVLDLEKGIGSKLSAKLAAFFTLGKDRRHEFNARWCLRWLEAVEQSTGRRPWLYLPRWAYDAYLSRAPAELLAELRTYRHWLASYNGGVEPARPLPAEWGECSAWQFTGSGSLDGVDGDVDLSWALLEDLHVV